MHGSVDQRVGITTRAPSSGAPLQERRVVGLSAAAAPADRCVFHGVFGVGAARRSIDDVALEALADASCAVSDGDDADGQQGVCRHLDRITVRSIDAVWAQKLSSAPQPLERPRRS